MADAKQITGDSGLHVHVVTPVGPVADERTDAITAPGEEGEFEVLPGHIPFLTAMHPGVLILGDAKGRQIFAVSRGYLRVDQAGNVEVLVEKAVSGADVDLPSAEAAKKDTAVELERWSEAQNADWRTLKDRFDWAQAQIDAHAQARS